MPLDRPLPDEPREALKMLWSVAEDQQIDINRHRDSLHKVWHVAPPKPREGMLVYADGVNWNPGSGAGYYVYYAGAWHPMSGGGGGGGGYTIVQDEGVALTVRTTLNFVGAGVTATDDGTRTVVTIPGGGGGAVSSVFTRTGAVVAVTGDYTAAQVTNAVSVLGSYPNPTWIPSYAYSKLTGVPTSFTPAAHVHAAADVTTGVMAVARLGTGTPSSSTYLRGDGAWTAMPAPGSQTPWLSHIDGAGFNLSNVGIVQTSYIQFPFSATPTWDTASRIWAESGFGTRYDAYRHGFDVGAARTRAMTIFDNGSVGIGTASPAVTCDVRGGIDLSNTARIWRNGHDNYYKLETTDGSALQMSYSATATPILTCTYNGNVGIGTTTPTSKLSVVGLPTSAAGLAAGDIWMDAAAGRVLKIV